ncbi:M16 family metallopeptidase [Streptomyces violascens]|uniref:M16 family metallopeptidase n=1 Tax=Streptomyces violascens TaxID=67381 RepID=UPI00379B0417
MALPFGVVRRRITRGVTAIVRPDPALGFVALNVWHGVGSLHDPPGKSGLAHVVEHVLFGAVENGVKPTHHGGSANATTSFERTIYVGTGAPDTLPALLSQAVQRLKPADEGIAPPALNLHCRVVLEEIRQREASARFGSGLRRSLRLLFGTDHPFGKPPLGRPEEIEAITASDVEEFIERAYRSAPVIVSLVGSVEPEYALDLLARCFAELPSECRSSDHRRVASAVGGYRREDVREGQPTGMLRYTFALPAEGEPLAVAGEVAMSALAGATWAAIGNELVREYGLFGASAQHLRCGTGSSLGLVKVSVPAGVNLDQLDQAVTERWRSLAGSGLDEGVLTAARARRGKEYLAVLSRARACGEELCHQEAWWGGAARSDERLRAIRSVSGAQVAEIAAQYLTDPVLIAFHADQQRSTSWIA